MYRMEQFYRAKIRILQKIFGKDSYISQTEAEHLAKTLNVQPVQVQRWFRRQRYNKGTCVAYRLLKMTLV